MLGWSINLFRVFGIRLAVHFSFLLLVAYAAWAGWSENPTDRWTGLTLDLVLIILLFTCIVLHELGHSLTARRYGIGVSRILLLPIGGMAEFDSIPRQPRRELLISLAGPAVNFSIALLLLIFLPWPKSWGSDSVEFSARGLGDLLLRLNLIMGSFNLLPVFPMDGGRILRALLATRLPYLRATFWAATIGKVLAVSGAVWFAFFTKNPNPVAVCLFLFIMVAGDLEYRAVKRRELQTAQWETLVRNLYGPAQSAEGLASDLLHGRN
jgi:Zn-dependent protease